MPYGDYYTGQAGTTGAMGWTTTTSSITNTFISLTGGSGATSSTSMCGGSGALAGWTQATSTGVIMTAQEAEAFYQRQVQGAYNRMIAQQQEAWTEREAIIQQGALAAQAMTEEQRRAEAIRLGRAEAIRLNEHNRQAAERAAAHAEARARARELLLSKLSPEQKKTFSDSGWFIVEGGRTKTKYRIRSNTYTGNIDVLDVSNNVRYRLCVHCSGEFPLEDHLVSQKVMLELAEDDIVGLANRHAA